MYPHLFWYWYWYAASLYIVYALAGISKCWEYYYKDQHNSETVCALCAVVAAQHARF